LYSNNTSHLLELKGCEEYYTVMNKFDDNKGKRLMISFPPRDPNKRIAVIEGRKRHEIKFARHLLKYVSQDKKETDFKTIELSLGDASNDSDIQLFAELFYESLEKKGVIQKFKIVEVATTMANLLNTKPLSVSFNAYPEKLVNYLNDYIKTEGSLQDRTVIVVEPNYGFYKQGNREMCYRITQRGIGKKNFLFVDLLSNKGELPASKIAATVGIRSNKVSDMHKQINEQFKKHCGLFHDLIFLNQKGNYCINGEFLIKESKEPDGPVKM